MLRVFSWGVVATPLLLVAAGDALAQEVAPLPAAPGMAAETAFVLNSFLFLFAGVLVMWMAAGFTMLEAGLVRTKNTSAICLKNMAIYAVAGLMYFLLGYNLMYVDVSGWIGSLSFFYGASEAELAPLKRAYEAPAEPAPPPPRRSLPDHLPRETVTHAPPCTCPECGGDLRPLGEDVSEMIEIVPQQFRVIRHLRPKLSCGRCSTVVQAPAPEEEVDGKPGKFAYPPNLVVVDGGLPQVRAAQAALSELGVTDVAVVGLAKRLEEVWLPDQEYPVVLPRSSEALYLLQRVRDEAHRFANTFHRQRRSRSMTVSALDGIPGLGPARQKALLRHFGSVKALRAADLEQLQEVPGVGPALAQTVLTRLRDAQPGPAVNLSTGEVLD